jgi:pyruvate kinase
MIARGDLAIELSFERLAEMQEELLWFGEACHLPVVWATQVLETAAHSGIATRAEVTDAAMSMRAECVMLNKGAHIATATSMLVDIIKRMEGHQYKKRSLYRKLAIAGGS